MTRRYALGDGPWERIKDLLPGQVGQSGATARDNRLFITAVLYRYRTGIDWSDLPARSGDFHFVHTRYDTTGRNFLGAIHLAASMVWLN